MNDTSTRPDGMAGKIEEEFEKWWSGKYPGQNEQRKLALISFHAASKPLMEENEKLKKELKGVNPFTGCKCKLYESERSLLVESKRDAAVKENKELREVLDLATSQLTGFIDSDKAFTELRLKFNLDNNSKGGRV